MKLLLISNSTNAGEEYLDHPKQQIREFLGNENIRCLFIPYAGVTISYDEYSDRVTSRFREIGHDIVPVHQCNDPVEAVREAAAIVVGGGNTFQLLTRMQENKLIQPIRGKVMSGVPYIGWSAGANLACPTIRTTNDMPIVEPADFNALDLVPFQINPHYTDVSPDGHAGETREMRIEEFLVLNPDIYVAGLREGTMFLIENRDIRLIGSRNLRVFKNGIEAFERKPGDDCSFLMGNEKAT